MPSNSTLTVVSAGAICPLPLVVPLPWRHKPVRPPDHLPGVASHATLHCGGGFQGWRRVPVGLRGSLQEDLHPRGEILLSLPQWNNKVFPCVNVLEGRLSYRHENISTTNVTSDGSVSVFPCTERSRGLHRWDEVLPDGFLQNLHGLRRGHVEPAELWGPDAHRSVQSWGLWSRWPQCLVRALWSWLMLWNFALVLAAVCRRSFYCCKGDKKLLRFLPVTGTAVWMCRQVGRCWWLETTWESSSCSVWTDRRSEVILLARTIIRRLKRFPILWISCCRWAVQIFSNKLHKSKVSHAEFNTRCDWLLATASIDHTVKLWDLRNIKDKNSYLHDLPHEKAVNSGKTPEFGCLLRSLNAFTVYSPYGSVSGNAQVGLQLHLLLYHSLLQPGGLLQTAHHGPVRPDPGLLVLRLVQASANHTASPQTVSAPDAHQGFFTTVGPNSINNWRFWDFFIYAIMS